MVIQRVEAACLFRDEQICAELTRETIYLRQALHPVLDAPPREDEAGRGSLALRSRGIEPIGTHLSPPSGSSTPPMRQPPASPNRDSLPADVRDRVDLYHDPQQLAAD